MRIHLAAAILFLTPGLGFAQNSSQVVQIGIGNMQRTMQEGINSSGIVQLGGGNTVAVMQDGRFNTSAITQIGNGFTSTATQVGNFQTYGSFQIQSRNPVSFSITRSDASSRIQVTAHFGVNQN
ncbi:MAG: hypothetical protein WCD16_07730 [Paracoccaceae bacterium]